MDTVWLDTTFDLHLTRPLTLFTDVVLFVVLFTLLRLFRFDSPVNALRYTPTRYYIYLGYCYLRLFVDDTTLRLPRSPTLRVTVLPATRQPVDILPDAFILWCPCSLLCYD